MLRRLSSVTTAREKENDRRRDPRQQRAADRELEHQAGPFAGQLGHQSALWSLVEIRSIMSTKLYVTPNESRGSAAARLREVQGSSRASSSPHTPSPQLTVTQ